MMLIKVDCNPRKKYFKKTVEFESILRKIRDKLNLDKEYGK